MPYIVLYLVLSSPGLGDGKSPVLCSWNRLISWANQLPGAVAYCSCISAAAILSYLSPVRQNHSLSPTLCIYVMHIVRMFQWTPVPAAILRNLKETPIQPMKWIISRNYRTRTAYYYDLDWVTLRSLSKIVLLECWLTLSHSFMTL